ncbi:MAG: N-acetyltransferase [Burkholderiaceae bacterium]|nr:MAG: N-acetyltransferase [Burkholderiaceae bacterium]
MFSLVACDQNGIPTQASLELPDALFSNCQATAELYQRIGFCPPWVGYVTVVENRAVGGGAFVGAPQEGCVEIAYFTLDHEQGKGYAFQTAAALVAIARAHDPTIRIKAFTLKEENASTRILRKLGFVIVGLAQDPDAGEVWEWQFE